MIVSKNQRLLGKILEMAHPAGDQCPGDRVGAAPGWFSQFVANLSKLRWQVIALASLVYFVSLFARVFAWYILLQKRVSFKDAFFALNAGYLLNNVFPFRLGEIGRALLLDRPEGPRLLRCCPAW